MKLSLLILLTSIMAEIAENSNLRTPKPSHMVLDDMFKFDGSDQIFELVWFCLGIGY